MINISNLEKKIQKLSEKIVKYQNEILILKESLHVTKLSLRKEKKITINRKKTHINNTKKGVANQIGAGLTDLFKKKPTSYESNLTSVVPNGNPQKHSSSSVTRNSDKDSFLSTMIGKLSGMSDSRNAKPPPKDFKGTERPDEVNNTRLQTYASMLGMKFDVEENDDNRI